MCIAPTLPHSPPSPQSEVSLPPSVLLVQCRFPSCMRLLPTCRASLCSSSTSYTHPALILLCLCLATSRHYAGAGSHGQYSSPRCTALPRLHPSCLSLPRLPPIQYVPFARPAVCLLACLPMQPNCSAAASHTRHRPLRLTRTPGLPNCTAHAPHPCTGRLLSLI